MHPLRSLLIVLALIAGAVSGLGAFTFRYAEGLSYLSNDPQACRNCHIMNEQYDSWRKGPHHAVATCNDCHVPHDLLGKYIAKAENGYHHSKAFTLQDFHEPIQIKPKNAAILQANCIECHRDFVHEIVPGPKVEEAHGHCVHCHRGVGHGAIK